MRRTIFALMLLGLPPWAAAQVLDETTDTITWVVGTTLDAQGRIPGVIQTVTIDDVGRTEDQHCVQWPVVPDAPPLVHCWITVPKLSDGPHTFAVTFDDGSGILRRFQLLNANPGKPGSAPETISLTRTRTITMPVGSR